MERFFDNERSPMVLIFIVMIIVFIDVKNHIGIVPLIGEGISHLIDAFGKTVTEWVNGNGIN